MPLHQKRWRELAGFAASPFAPHWPRRINHTNVWTFRVRGCAYRLIGLLMTSSPMQAHSVRVRPLPFQGPVATWTASRSAPADEPAGRMDTTGTDSQHCPPDRSLD